jgi:acyl-CoA hydrolase
MAEARTVSDSRVVMTELVLPTHTNALGSIFGGVVMSWIDIAAAISAQRHSRKQVVTASIDALHFVAPVYKGWIVNLIASVNYTARSSMEVGVRVDAENPKTGERFHTATAYLTFVAVDENLKPTQIEPIVPQSEDEKRRYNRAQERRRIRLEQKKASI